MNISFLTTGHYPFDDRIFYHMASSLSQQNHVVEIISSKINLIEDSAGIKLNCFAGDDFSKRDKIKLFYKRLADFSPEVIICSEPLTILAAKKYSKKQPGKIRIIYDITEWYPSRKNLTVHNPLIRWFFFIKLLLFNLWASKLADSFIFGEWFKSRPYRFFFPRKSFIFTTYYPDLKYIPYRKPDLKKGNLRLAYSGKISLEKGYHNFFNVLNKLTELRNDLLIDVQVIGWYESLRDKDVCENLFTSVSKNIHLNISERLDFEKYLELIKETDIFIDLRSDNLENQHCLPIKLFYHAAFGRPVIFSDLKSIRKETEIEKFGFLVNPKDSDQCARLIINYINDSDLYYNHCENARSIAENYYNWKKAEPHFLKFITSN
jgi:glycosyltransferase involved in cell wall biosynthesis